MIFLIHLIKKLFTMVRARYFPENNYAAIFDNLETIRFQLRDNENITAPQFPEFYDIAINNLCYANCPYCYVNAANKGRNFNSVIEKINEYFGPMSVNEKPFQIALGGHGEPTLHPDFLFILQKFQELGIVPNYTTNGMHLSDNVLRATKLFAGGVAVSMHPHLNWSKAVKRLVDYTRVHLHVIISNKESVDEFARIYNKLNDLVEAFVLLPYQAIGRASRINTEFEYLFRKLKEWELPKIAYGARFYEYLLERPWLNASLYEPHMFSKYLVLDDPVMEYKSSFEVVQIDTSFGFD